MVIFYKKWKKYNSIDKKQNGRKYSKNDKSSTLPAKLNISTFYNKTTSQLGHKLTLVIESI